LARVIDDGVIENVYRLQVMNNREQAQLLRLQVHGPAGLQLRVEGNRDEVLRVPAEALSTLVVSLHLPAVALDGLRGSSVPIEFVLDGQVQGAAADGVRERSTFYVPR